MPEHAAVEILLVEDNPADAEMAIRALTRKNLANHLVWVKDGEEALDFLFRAGRYEDLAPDLKPRLILLDLKMPKVDGLEVLARLKSDERTSLIPVVMLTSSKEEQDIVASYRLRVNSYIVKPVDFTQFFEAVESAGLYWMVTNHLPTQA
ncbi:MAG TPA: response regulator [Holophagaceae bacterium]|nr:response regulator [Holophagaceae bacterium]